jgi:hypothetical protein
MSAALSESNQHQLSISIRMAALAALAMASRHQL